MLFCCFRGPNCRAWIPVVILRGGGGKKKEGAKIGDETGLYLEINNAAPGPSS